MKINNLKLRGAIGIWKGLGKEEIEIDFLKFTNGLIALTGKNGAGKTTVMENLHPYRCMVSRTGSLQSHFFLKDSYRILEFEHNNELYESKILIDALTGGSEAYLLQNGTPLNDGKLSTYDEALESILGSQELFFNSVFSAQKSKGIAELKPAERRKLFYELLNLNIYGEYLEKAKQQLKSNELKLAEIDGQITAISNESDSVAALEIARTATLEEQARLISDISDIEEELSKINSEIRNAEVKISNLKIKQTEQAEIETKLEDFSTVIDAMTEKLNLKVSHCNSEIGDNKTLIKRYEKLTENIEHIESKISEKNILAEKNNKIIEIKNRLSEDKNEALNKLQIKEAETTKKEKTLIFENTELIMLSSKKNDTSDKIDRYNKSISTVSNVPCDDDTGHNCQFLLDAYSQREELPKLIEELSELEIKIEKKEKEVERLDSQLKDEKEILEDVKHRNEESFNERENILKEQFDKNCQKIDTICQTDWENLLEESKTSENNIKLCKQKIKAAENSIDEARLSFDENLKRIQDEAGILQAKLNRNLEQDITLIEDYLQETKRNDEFLNEKIKEKNTSLTDSNHELSVIDERIEKQKANKRKIAELNLQKEGVQKELKDWAFLTKAFDKTGIPVLKLENSGVEITTLANELLSLFENQFRIVFETTKLKADKKNYKESFDINVISGDDVVEISNLSGGQQVWVETAIQLAISLLVRQQGINIETSFLDEKDGALDVENAHLYLNMLKLAHQKSGVHNTFVITHRPELIDLIPQKITLADGLLMSEVA